MSCSSGRHTISAQAFDLAGNPSAKFYRDVVVIEDHIEPGSATLPAQWIKELIGVVP